MTFANRAVVSALTTPFQACKDAESAFRTAAHFVEPEKLKTLLERYAEQRADYAAELHSEIERLGGHSGNSGTIVGTLQRGWTKLQSAVTGGDEKSLLAECGRGEDLARKQYEPALTQGLSADVQAVVRRQSAGIQEAQERLWALEGAAP